MGKRIKIQAGSIALSAELNDSPTAQAIAAALPLRAVAQRWGDEIYFSIPVNCSPEKTAVETVQVGDLGYWPTGRAFCIFFGPTPISRGNEIRPASAVNPVGKVMGDATAFKAVRDGEPVEIVAE
ncbi:MAG: hypothetical protein KBH99_04850 [Syntrophobacteraceae bacterium]|nr:hypothetical protein [Syntrophobacteraceae bacterium]